ncbi:MAG: lipase family protein [Candidatus Binataceae bacterium]
MRVSVRALFTLLLTAFAVSMSACGGGSSSSGSSHPAPFDRKKGEGVLISDQLVTTYPTATIAPATGLDTFYSQLICSGLSQQNCATNISNLDTPQFGNFNLAADPIGSNPLGIPAVDAVKIDYTAINVDGTAVTVSGGIVIPKIAAASLKGLILYFHGTTVQRTNVPSAFTTATNLSSYTDSILLAALWASQGYVVVMPDYIGLGDDTTHPHPYVVYPDQNAQSGLAMLKAARIVLSSSYRVVQNLPLFVTGYSEGGAYALEAAHLMQDNPRYASELKVRLREAAPMSGFFDLSGTGLPYLFDNISATNNKWYSLSPLVSALSKPYLTTYLALSFANYADIAPTDILASNYYNCPSGTTACGPGNNLDGLYFTAPQSAGYDATVTALSFSFAAATGWSTSNNAITSFLTPGYADGLMNRDLSNPLYQKVLSADTYQFVPKFPVTLVSLAQDSVVTRVNTDVAYSYFTDQNPGGPYKEELVDNSNFLVPGFFSAAPIDHTSEVPFLSVLLLNQFNTAPVTAVRRAVASVDRARTIAAAGAVVFSAGSPGSPAADGFSR